MSPALTDFSNALADAVAALGPAVVRVEGRDRLPATGIVWSADGVIVTAHHVLEQDENIGIGLADGRTVSARLAGRDPTTDLAVLRAEASGLTPPAWIEPDRLRVGHLALALGRPGHTVMATLGIVSALGKPWRTPAGGEIDQYLQTDITMYPGFSGGPLVSATGEVAGLNTSALLRGVSVALPVPTLRRVVESLLAHGHVRRGYLGIGAQAVRLPANLAEQLGQETGLLLLSVEAGSPAEKGGLVLGDTIVAVGGQAVHHLDELLASLGGDRIGASTPIRIVRGGEVQERMVVVGER
ncbi:MAG TPA: trypsin-like peptidase domain-containing protein [Anaerolineae bacterium]